MNDHLRWLLTDICIVNAQRSADLVSISPGPSPDGSTMTSLPEGPSGIWTAALCALGLRRRTGRSICRLPYRVSTDSCKEGSPYRGLHPSPWFCTEYSPEGFCTRLGDRWRKLEADHPPWTPGNPSQQQELANRGSQCAASKPRNPAAGSRRQATPQPTGCNSNDEPTWLCLLSTDDSRSLCLHTSSPVSPSQDPIEIGNGTTCAVCSAQQSPDHEPCWCHLRWWSSWMQCIAVVSSKSNADASGTYARGIPDAWP